MSCMQFNARSYHQGGGAEGKRTEFEVARQEYSESGKEERIGGKWRKEMCSSSCRSVCLLAPAWLEGVPCRLGLASSLGGPMAPPKCSGPCGGTTLTELTSRSLRSTWGAAEGSKWSWCWHASRKSLCAYWHCCLDCHKLAWPGDGRQQNRHSYPTGLRSAPWPTPPHVGTQGANLQCKWPQSRPVLGSSGSMQHHQPTSSNIPSNIHPTSIQHHIQHPPISN